MKKDILKTLEFALDKETKQEKVEESHLVFVNVLREFLGLSLIPERGSVKNGDYE